MAARQRTRRNANGEGGVYRRADGRWEGKFFVDTPDGRRKRVSVYADSEQAALNQLNRLRDQRPRGIPVATTTVTVAEHMSYWREHIAEPASSVLRMPRAKVMSVCILCPASASAS
jgi:hypothetical protein